VLEGDRASFAFGDVDTKLLDIPPVI